MSCLIQTSCLEWLPDIFVLGIPWLCLIFFFRVEKSDAKLRLCTAQHFLETFFGHLRANVSQEVFCIHVLHFQVKYGFEANAMPIVVCIRTQQHLPRYSKVMKNGSVIWTVQLHRVFSYTQYCIRTTLVNDIVGNLERILHVTKVSKYFIGQILVPIGYYPSLHNALKCAIHTSERNDPNASSNDLQQVVRKLIHS